MEEGLSSLKNNTLVIEQVELDDSAKYTCSVQNAFGKDEASSIVKIIGLYIEHLFMGLCSVRISQTD